jgi:hypothetical protein
MTGEKISRVTTRSRVIDWLATKKPEIASTSLAFYQNSLGKLLEFLQRSGRCCAKPDRTR